MTGIALWARLGRTRSSVLYRWQLVLIFIVLSASAHSCLAQNEEEPKFEINGYVKTLQSLFAFDVDGVEQSTFSDNLIHQRLNLQWYINDSWTFQSGIRTRLFFGEFTRLQPNLGASLDEGGNDVINMTLINTGDEVILHSIVDRAFLEYSKGNLEVRIGRQRVNWGINTIWNPNDLFNAYSFTDFDYEERPGSDALRVRYFLGYTGSVEFAIKAFDNSDEVIAAGLWKFNVGAYDIQLLSGWSNKDVVIGGGWAGNLGDVGFKGEWSWFNSSEEDTDNAFAATLSWDYVFSNGLFLVSGMLYNHLGINQDVSNIFSFNLSARNLYPYKWSLLNQVSYPVSPLFTTGVAIIYSPVSGHPMFVNPTMTYSLGQNIDADFVGQFAVQLGESTFSDVRAFFLRLKWSF